MNFIKIGAALAASLAGLCLAQPASTATTWKLATGFRAESFHTQNIAQFAREAGAASGGQLTDEVFPNSQALALSATEVLRANGVKIERIPSDVALEIKRKGEKFSREWVRSVGNEANTIFVPYYIQ